MTDDKFDIWMLFSLNQRGQLCLNGVFTSQSRARSARKLLLNQHPTMRPIRAWIELGEANHLFASSVELPFLLSELRELKDEARADVLGMEKVK